MQRLSLHSFARLFALSLALLAGACAPAGGPGSARPEAATTVRVTNRNWSDVVVYVADGVGRYRLGLVASTRTETFRLPRTLNPMSNDLRLVADPVGRTGTFVSEPLRVLRGQTVELSVEPSISTSSLSLPM